MLPASPNTASRAQVSTWVRGAAIVALLAGSLYPSLFGVPLVQIAAVTLAPFILWTIIHGLPMLHRSACLVVVLAAGLAVSWLFHPPISEYGQTKTSIFATLTLLTAASAVLIRNRLDLAVWAKVWLASGALLAVVALTGGVNAAGRAVGDDVNPIWLARAIASPAVALLWLVYQRMIAKWLAGFAGALLLSGLVATGSRGPFAAVAIGGVIIVATSSAKSRALRVVTIGVVTVIGLYILSVSQIMTTSRIGEFLADPASSSQSSDRIKLILPTLDIIAQHPGGVGLGNWRAFAAVGPFIYPHNLWLEVLAEAGWTIGAGLIVMVFIVVRSLWRASRTDPAAVLALGVLAFEIMSVSVSGDLNARTFFFTLALGYAVSWWSKTTATQDLTPVSTLPPSETSAPSQPSRTGS